MIMLGNMRKQTSRRIAAIHRSAARLLGLINKPRMPPVGAIRGYIVKVSETTINKQGAFLCPPRRNFSIIYVRVASIIFYIKEIICNFALVLRRKAVNPAIQGDFI